MTLQDIINKKIENQAKYNEFKKELDDLDVTLIGSRFTRWFGTSYLVIKRIVTLLLGLLFLALALFFLISPTSLLEDEELKQELVLSIKQEYAQIAGDTMTESVNLMIEDGSEFTVDQFANHLDDAFEQIVEKELIQVIRIYGALFIVIAIVFFYITRLTGKIRKRNSKISKAEALTQDIIEDYRKLIDSHEVELAQLQEIQNRDEDHQA